MDAWIPAQSEVGRSLAALREPPATALTEPFGFAEGDGSDETDAFSTEAIVGAVSKMSDGPRADLSEDGNEDIDMSLDDDEDEEDEEEIEAAGDGEAT